MNDQTNLYLKLEPEKIILIRNREGKYSATLTLVNTSTEYIIFKIYINKDNIYASTPSVGYVEPSGSTSFLVKRISPVLLC